MTDLQDVECRAGASDTDRVAWLAERAQGITATQVRDLLLKGPSYRAALMAEKRGTPRTVADNQWMAWGRTREPILAAWVLDRYGIAPESRVFHAQSDSRFLASPDGLGEVDGGLVCSEIKTSKKRPWPGTDVFQESGYMLQMQWQMFVLDADRCLYVLEQHDDDWRDRGGRFPEPAPLSWDESPDPDVMWVDRDEALIGTLREAAEAFLTELEAGPSAMVADLIGRLAEAREARDDAKANVLRYEGELRALLGEGGSADAHGWRATIGREYTRAAWDTKALDAAHPELAEKFKKDKPYAGRFSFTKVETDGEA